MNVFDTIANELNIEKYLEENNDQFSYRVFYSLAGEWMKSLAQSAGNENVRINKASLRGVIKDLYNALVSSNENLVKMCFTEDDDDFNYIRDTLFRSGDLVEYGFPSKVCSCLEHFYSISDKYSIHVGRIGSSGRDIVSGLSFLSKAGEEDTNTSIFNAFNIPEAGYKNTYEKYAKRLKKNNMLSLDGLEFFNINSKKVFSASWENTPFYNSDNITIGREKLNYSGYQYRIIKKCEEFYCSYDFNEFEQLPDVRETQRLIYAVKKEYGKPATVSYENKGLYSRWTYWSRLPSPEEYLLRYIGWPLNGLRNQNSSFLIRSELDDLVNKMNNNLGIERNDNDG